MKVSKLFVAANTFTNGKIIHPVSNDDKPSPTIIPDKGTTNKFDTNEAIENL